MASRVLDIPWDASLLELEQRLANGGTDPRTAAALGFARRMARAAAVDADARKELLAAGWSVPEANEIAACVAATVFHNRLGAGGASRDAGRAGGTLRSRPWAPRGVGSTLPGARGAPKGRVALGERRRP